MKILFALLLSLAGGSSFAQSCTTTLNPGANLASAVSGAAAGATLCLNSGNWGSAAFNGIAKTSYVTIRSTTGVGATISPTVGSGSQYLRFSSLTISGMSISGATTKHITVNNSTFTQKLDIVTTNFANNDILIDGNTFNGINSGGGAEGRVSVRWPNGPGNAVAGVTISNNSFGGGGCSDGVQLGAYGVVVGPGNTFTGLTQGSCSEHVDAIQGYGQSHSVIRGNYFLKPRVCLGFYDGGNGEVFENNVFVGSGGVDGTQCVIDLGSITSASFRHNTVYNIGMRVGGINQSGGGSGTYSDNILIASSFNSGSQSSCSSCTFNHNLFSSSSSAKGTNNIIAMPTFLGGLLASTYAGWQLTSGSAGYRAATDGTDMGAVIAAQVTIAPPTALRIVP